MDDDGEAREPRYGADIDGLARELGNVDGVAPLRNCYTGSILLGYRKSVEPIAALVAPCRVAAEHQ